MNPWIPVLIASGIIGHLLITAFYYGKLTQKLSDVTDRVRDLETRNFGERLARLEAVRNGQTARTH